MPGSRSTVRTRFLRPDAGRPRSAPHAEEESSVLRPIADLRPDATEELAALLRERILVLDGAMGTADPARPARRGRATAASGSPTGRSDLKGNNDLLTLTQPEIIARRSTASTSRPAPTSSRPTRSTPTRSRSPTTACRTSPTSSTSRPRGWPARVGRRGRPHDPERPRYVAGALGPTTRTASISPDVNDPAARNVTYDQLVAAYLEAARGLVDGGSDLLLDRDDLRHPQRQGRDLRRRDAVRGARPPLAGDRLGHDHRRLRPHAVRPGHRGVLELGAARPAARRRAQLRARRQGDAALHRGDRRIADTFVSCYPNAGLPNAFGEYDEAPDETAAAAFD